MTMHNYWELIILKWCRRIRRIKNIFVLTLITSSLMRIMHMQLDPQINKSKDWKAVERDRSRSYNEGILNLYRACDE